MTSPELRRDILFSKVFAKNASLWSLASIDHPFLQGCVTGAVTTTQFDTWLVQDFKYVHHFLSFLQKSLGNATSVDDQAILQGTSYLTPYIKLLTMIENPNC